MKEIVPELCAEDAAHLRQVWDRFKHRDDVQHVQAQRVRIDSWLEGATVKDSHGQTVQSTDALALRNRIEMFGPEVGEYIFRLESKLSTTESDLVSAREGQDILARKLVMALNATEAAETTPTIVQDYREYTADQILHGIVKLTERSGWGDPANLGHWLGAAQRWDRGQK